jgi:VWFA-related protein
MAVVAYDGRKIDMLSNWSDSERALSRAFQVAMGRQAYGFQRLAELRAFEASRRLTAGTLGTVDSRSAFATRGDLEEQGYMELVADQVGRSVMAAVSTMRGFGGPPGRKVMILLSGGWPFSAADYVVNNPNRPILNREVPTGEQIFAPLVDTANLLGYTIYPVDVPGVESTGPDASEGAPSTNGLLNLREQEVHASLEYAARETGGKALINGLRSEALQTAESDTRSYYWLGFSPERQRNDKRHEIKVDVLREGLKVRSRNDYFDLAKNTEVGMIVESALLFGNPPGAASMPMQVGKPVAKGRREIEVPITIAIPLSSMTVVPIDGKHVAELELRISVLDEKGNRSAVPVIPIRLVADKPPAEQPGQYVRYDTTLKMRKIRQHLIAAIYDPLSGKITTAEADVVPDRVP